MRIETIQMTGEKGLVLNNKSKLFIYVIKLLRYFRFVDNVRRYKLSFLKPWDKSLLFTGLFIYFHSSFIIVQFRCLY